MKRIKTLLLFIFCSFFQKCSDKKESTAQAGKKYNDGWEAKSSPDGYGVYGYSTEGSGLGGMDSGIGLHIKSESWKTGEYVILKDGGRSIKKDSL